MYFKKIVFTGGPCGGKTTLIKEVTEYLKEKDCEVLILPEAATKIFGIGFRYDMINNIDNFQKLIFDAQIAQEKLVDFVLNLNKKSNKKFIVIYDRGVLDNKAYFDSHEGFDNLLNSEYSEIDFLDSYDLVFDIITLADCKPDEYNLSSNEARSEDKDLALKIDRKTSNAWAGHRNINIINTSITIDEELEIIKNKIDELLACETTKETKSVELDNDIDDFYEYNDNNSRLIKIEEIIINIPSNKNVSYKVFKRTYKDKNSYILNVSYNKNNKNICVYDCKLTESEYKKIISSFKIKETLKYRQLSFIKERQAYDIKFYSDKTILEYEENVLNEEFVLPKPIKIKENEYKRELILKPMMKLSIVKENFVV